ncbi:MAG: cofactor-independent phosphoglycerate mutase [Candidatus Hydrogenedentota bacterium]
MKYAILIGDGMADEPQDKLDGRTPLEAAHTPAMDALVQHGTTGLYWPIPEGMPAGSEIGNLSLFGYDPRHSFKGRAPMEAANQGITLAADEVAFRCNLATLSDGVMRDFTAGHISSEEGAAIVDSLNEALGPRFPVRFHNGVGYRHLAIVRAQAGATVADYVDTDCAPPHDIMDQPHEPHWPKGPGAKLVTEIMRASHDVLAEHPVNRQRTANNQLPATSIWLWGQGVAPKITPYQERFGLSGAVISAVDLVNGIGLLAGFEVVRVPGATGWIDTNYAGKVSHGLDALDRHDLVYIHIEAPDETSHQGRTDLKLKAIEDFDAQVVAPFLAEIIEKKRSLRLLVAPDHFTLLRTKGHGSGATPFAMAGPGVPVCGQTAYSEQSAAATGIRITEGFRVTEWMLTREPLAFAG